MLENFLGRSLDRKIRRPVGLTYAMDDRPPLATTFGLALQHVAIQSIYFVLPAIIAGFLSGDQGDATRFLCLSMLAAALWQALQLLPRGPVGSGYPIPGTHTAATLVGYALVGQAGGGFGAASAIVFIVGAAMVALTFVMRRTRLFLPNEVAGVVVILIGVALLALGLRRLGLTGGAAPDPLVLVSALASILVMAVVALTQTPAKPFAVLIGAIVGIVVAELLGRGVPGAAQILAARPWVALPRPWLPDFGAVTAGPLLAFLIPIVALKATALGTMVVAQRGSDASWTLPDPRPLRRGLLANGAAVMAAGLFGGACPGPAAAAIGLSVATGTLARRIVWVGAAIMATVALFPKIVALFILIPYPVQGAMLFYVAGFIMAQGCQLVTARLLDARRALIVAMGLSAGLAVSLASRTMETWAPAIASPISFGALVAFIVNLITLPLVKRRATLSLSLDAKTGAAIVEWFGGLGGSWGLRAQTVANADAALTEILHTLAGRGQSSVALTAIRQEDRVELRIAWDGPPLPAPSGRPHYEDLLGSDAAMEAFAVWMATRRAQSFRQRATATGSEAVLFLED